MKYVTETKHVPLGFGEIAGGALDEQAVTLKGAVHSLRAMGGITFLALRVRDGAVQCVCRPEELPEAERTASTPRPWVSLYLDNGAFPSRWTMTEYLVENGQAVRAREVGLSPYGAGNGWLLRLLVPDDFN